MSGAAARAMIERNPAKRGRDGRPGLTWRGDWKRSETYAPGDVVAFEGSAYVATTPTQGVKPPAGFDLVARKGDPGRDGQTPKFLGGGGPPLNIMDEGVAVGPVNTLNFVGSGIAASIRADGIGVVTASGGGASLTVKDEGSNLDTAVTSLDFTGAGVSATAVGHAVTVNVSGGGGGTPTLAEVLVAGNDPGGTSIQSDDGAGGYGATLSIVAGGPTGGGTISMASGDSTDNAHYGASINCNSATDTTHGYLNVSYGETSGNLGQFLMVTDDPADQALGFASLYSQAAGPPGGTLTTLLYGDTTAVTGGLYVWNGSSYRKLTGVLP